MDRTSDCFGGVCSGPPRLEPLEDRQLLSGVLAGENLSADSSTLTQIAFKQFVGPLRPGAIRFLQPLLERGIGQVEVATPVAPSDEQGQRLAAGMGQGESDDTVSVYLGNGDGSFQPAIQAVARARGRSTVEADFNRDGIPDLATVDPNSHRVLVLVGNGEGSFKVASVLQIRSSQGSVAIADVNRDGIPDLLVAEDTKRHVRPRSERSFEPELGQFVADSSPPRRVVALTAGARLGNREATAVNEAMSRTEPKAPRETGKGGDSPRMPGQDEEVRGLPALPVPASSASQVDCQEQAVGFLPGHQDLTSTPAGHLLAGLLPIDLPGLERKVDEFFRRIEQLAEDATEPERMARLTPWLATAAVVTAAYTFARRRLPGPGARDGVGGGNGNQRGWRAFLG